VSDQTTLEPVPPPTPQPKPKWRSRRVRIVGALTGAAAIAAVAALVLALAHPSGGKPAAAGVPIAWGRPAVSAAGLAERSGVQITQVAVTGSGGLVDLRFKVLDPAKAHAIHEPGTPPAVIDERTGLVLNQLFMGHAHEGEYRSAVTYYLVFENTGNWVHRGSKVAVLLGNAQVEHVVVA
jgi:hypothetical protein